MKKVYYARPLHLYNTQQEVRDIEMLNSLGLEIVNPNKEELQKRYEKEGMPVFLSAVKDCDALCFRAFPCGKISAGVKKEIDQALSENKPVFELPVLTENRVLSVDDTREYLKLTGQR